MDMWLLLGFVQLAYGLHLVNCKSLERKSCIALCILGIIFLVIDGIGFNRMLNNHVILLMVFYMLSMLMIWILFRESKKRK